MFIGLCPAVHTSAAEDAKVAQAEEVDGVRAGQKKTPYSEMYL